VTAKRRGFTPLAFHGVVIRARDPRALARKLREVLGWGVLRASSREIVLGDGPELWIAIRPSPKSESESVAELHLAVKDIARSRRKAEEDPLGGDSWSAEIGNALTLTVREPKRAPARSWVKKRPTV